MSERFGKGFAYSFPHPRSKLGSKENHPHRATNDCKKAAKYFAEPFNAAHKHND
jgi:hypothetical protein